MLTSPRLNHSSFALLLVLGCFLTTLRSAEPPPNREGEPEIGPVRSARQLFGLRIDKDGNELGKVKDVALDFGHGRVVALLVDSGKEGQSTTLVPIEHLELKPGAGEGEYRKDVRTLGRQLSPDEFNAASQVVLLSDARDLPVHNAKGELLGHVIDFGLAINKGLIAYAAFAEGSNPQAAEKLFPVPLGAFVVPSGSTRWILELPEGILEHTPTFQRGQWPDGVSRAWLEYVTVRYGRSPLGGVESELRNPQK